MKKNKQTIIIDMYKNIYDLKKINIVSDDNSCLHFLPYSNNEIYLINDGEMITYYSSMSNNIISYVHDIEIKYNVKVINYFPICFTNDNGVVLSCKIEKQSDLLVACSDKKGYKNIIDLNSSFNKSYNLESEKEFYITEKYYRRYNFYINYIKRYWLTDKRRKKDEFINLLKELFGKYESIIDDSCGDNEDVFKISNSNKLVVGNDINFSVISSLSEKYPDFLFTNHNIVNLPFKDKVFDVSYCKNTFHHLNGINEMKESVKSMLRISKKVIIIDVEDPKLVGGLPKFLNKNLYIKYLKDNGKDFLSYDTFKNIINESAKGYKIEYRKFENILGNYMIASIERR